MRADYSVQHSPGLPLPTRARATHANHAQSALGVLPLKKAVEHARPHFSSLSPVLGCSTAHVRFFGHLVDGRRRFSIQHRTSTRHSPKHRPVQFKTIAWDAMAEPVADHGSDKVSDS